MSLLAAFLFYNRQNHRMKLKILILLILIKSNVFAQDLPTNPATGLVSIRDTISLKDVSEKDFKPIISNWKNYLSQKTNVDKLFSVKSKQETITLAFLYGFFTSHAEMQKGIYTNSGNLSYFGYSRDPLFKEVSSVDWTNGNVSFNLIYSIKGNQFFYEFTNFEFTGSGSGGKFEDDKPVKPFTVGVLAQNKKRWKQIKSSYCDRFKVLSENLKAYVADFIKADKNDKEASAANSPISYSNYQNIKIGMSYPEVKKLLGSEGKELNNGTTQINGKAMIQQTIVWNDLDKSKSITVNFTDGKVTSKSQTNL